MVAIAGQIKFELNPSFDAKLKDTTAHALEKAALVWERNVKLLVTDEDHIVTGRYRASINLNASDGEERGTVADTQEGDGLHRFTNNNLSLEVGTNVEYAIYLEAKYNLLARGLSMSEKAMTEAFGKFFRDNL